MNNIFCPFSIQIVSGCHYTFWMSMFPPSPKPQSRLTALLAIACGLLLITVGWLLADRHRLMDLSGEGGLRTARSSSDIQQIYAEQISKLIDQNYQRNQQAAQRACKRLHENFEGYREGIDDFAEDVTGWGTRFGMAGRSAQDTWNKWWNKEGNASEVESYVLKKYEKHIVSQDQLQRDVDQAVMSLKQDMDANRNRLYAEIRLVLRTSSLPVGHGQTSLTNLTASIDLRLNQLISDSSTDSLVVGIASAVSGILVEEGLSFAVTAVFSELASVTAATAATSSTTVTSSTAAGGSAGSGAGPVGTIVGVGVGLVVGAIVDWWLTDSFKQKLSDECHSFLDALEEHLLQGTSKSRGLSVLFDEAVLLTDTAQRRAVLDTLAEGLE
jgi:hypothetical protein